MPAQFLLARPGQSQRQATGLTGGWTNTPLTDAGRRQAERLGEAVAALPGKSNAKLLSSDLLRTKETAEIIALEAGFTPEYTAELRERSDGTANGKTVEEARRMALPVQEPLVDWRPYPGTEGRRAMTRRIMGFLTRIAARMDSKVLVIVSHVNAMVAMVCW